MANVAWPAKFRQNFPLEVWIYIQLIGADFSFKIFHLQQIFSLSRDKMPAISFTNRWSNNFLQQQTKTCDIHRDRQMTKPSWFAGQRGLIHVCHPIQSESTRCCNLANSLNLQFSSIALLNHLQTAGMMSPLCKRWPCVARRMSFSANVIHCAKVVTTKVVPKQLHRRCYGWQLPSPSNWSSLTG